MAHIIVIIISTIIIIVRGGFCGVQGCSGGSAHLTVAAVVSVAPGIVRRLGIRGAGGGGGLWGAAG